MADQELAPFALVETSAGNFSLLLSTFSPADQVFERHGQSGGGYSWEGIARHLIERADSGLEGRLKLDPESSMFCAYGPDRDALAELGRQMAVLFHDAGRLEQRIFEIGPAGFDD